MAQRSTPASETGATDASPEWRVGAYRIVRELGRGGMGTVYLATRADSAYDKAVAVKFIKRGMDTDLLVRRFRRERQILASLAHPHIARLLDGGATDDGLPYFVMEYVDGEPIDAYCVRRALSVAERLALFRLVCGAVHFAHQNLVVHRDLKPSNVLVTADGTPKLLDFGLAKLLGPADPDGAAPSALTEMEPGAHALTPAYASPEQLRGDPVTTLTDVYSLGALLRELLRDAGGGPPRGDLATIVAKATHAEPARRYASAEQLADDVRRHLERRPVLARPDAWGYRAATFVRRNRAGVAAAALVLLSLAGGLTAAASQALVARAERARAEQRFGQVRRLANTLLFEVHDAIEPLAGATPARELVVRRSLEYLDRLAQSAARRPTRDDSLLRELGAAYERVGRIQGNSYHSNLGNSAGATASYEKALALRAALAGNDPTDRERQADLAASHEGVGDMRYTTNDLRGALASYERALAIRERLAAAAPADDEAGHALAIIHARVGDVKGLDGYPNLGDTRGALVHFRRAVALREPIAARRPDDGKQQAALGLALASLGMQLRTVGDLPGAIASGERAVRVFERLTARDSTNAADRLNLLSTLTTLRYAYVDEGRVAEALAISRATVPVLERMSAQDPQNTFLRRSLGVVYSALGRDLLDAGDRAAARASFERALAISRTLDRVDPGNAEHRRDIAFALQRVGEARAAAGDARGALAAYREAERINAAILAADSALARDRDDLAVSVGGIAAALAALGDAPGALREERRAAALAEQVAARSDAHAGFQRRLAGRLQALGDAHTRADGDAGRPAACAAYTRAAGVWDALRRRGAVRRIDEANAAAAARARAGCAAAE